MKTFFHAWPWLAVSALGAATSAPVARWDFGEEDVSRLVPVGAVQRDVPGPRPPEFPDFERNNTAAQLDGSGARFVLADPGASSPFDFTNGDAITLEAWVKAEGLRANENLYVIGKGRTGADGFAPDNQNWALRLRAVGGRFAVNFLFATPRAAGAAKADAHWHRWTTKGGFGPDSGWHHIAVTYRFGEPASVRGWIDGKVQTGTWDMGGAT
ncbi:MAG: LamG-like jellyroll fold domain-containing protein, partial [Sulfuricaulis sp.]|nr:LamG-like jellyroll fold domain-containing protein [Sulfuricaulis sp.]